MKLKRILQLLIILIAASVLNGCSKEAMPASNAEPGPNQVFISNYAYNPSTISVGVNTTVTWINKDPVAHTVTSTTGIFISGQIPQNGTYNYQFTSAGTYPYYCADHTNMKGTVVV